MKAFIIYFIFFTAFLTVAFLLPSGCTCFNLNNDVASKIYSPLEITFIDVGQGDSALLKCNDQTMLIDGGDSKQSQKLYSILDKNNISFLDYIVISYTDSDHCGGIPGALEKADVGHIYCSETNSDTKAWNKVVDSVNKRGKSIEIPEINSCVHIGDAHVSFLAPINKTSDDNNNSLVLKVEHGSNTFLFTGDAEEAEENDMLKNKLDVSSDVLKVSHHGSGKCTSQQFLDAVNPKYAIISVGKNNYGHPSEDVIHRLEQNNTTILRTDLMEI